MKSIRDIESVGWGFFLGVFAVLAGPGIYLAFQITYDTTTPGARALLGLVMAAIAAAFIAYGVNEALYRRNLRAYEKARHAERKAKKKKKGK